MTHLCLSRLIITSSDNGLSPGQRQAIIWTNAGILLIGLFGTNFSENLIEILTFSFMKMRLKVSSAKWRPFCLGLNVLKHIKSYQYIQQRMASHKIIYWRSDLDNGNLKWVSHWLTELGLDFTKWITDIVADAPCKHQGLYSLRRHRLTGIGIPMINLRRSDDRLRFIMGIPIPVRRRLLSE